MKLNQEKTVIYFLRFSIGVAFLSAVADRFSLWGPLGATDVAWGNFENFTQYTGTLNPLAPAAVIPTMAWFATILELALGLFLIVGFKIKESAFLSGCLLAIFALTMTFTLGIKAPLNYSVFSASAAAFALFLIAREKKA